jgi:LysR family transcriptional regulator, carnitine catabolism transcriptional activator
VALTPQGEALRELARRILTEAETALTEFEAYLAARRGRITLAGLPSVTAGLLPRLIRRFLASHPDVEISIIDALSDGVVAAVLEGRTDLGFTAGRLDSSGRLSFRPLLEDEFVAVARDRIALGGAPLRRWEDFVGQPFVAMTSGTSVRAFTDAACAQAGITLRPRFEVAHLVTAGALVAAGLGVTALPALTILVLGSGPLLTCPLEGPRLVRRIGVARATARSLSPSARAFYRVLTEAGATSLPADEAF